jgi:uncharacterized membrane protein YhhN
VTTSAWALLVIVAGFAVGDWIAVVEDKKQVEYLCKPATIFFLLALASSLDVDDVSVQHWFMLALALSLLGDVFLMLPRDRFLPGLVSFLLAHIAYIVGMWVDGMGVLALVIGLAIAGLAIVVVGTRIIDAINNGEHAAMARPVTAYIAIISLMLASAFGTGEGFAIAGAALFYASDALIAWERFVRPKPWHPLAIIVTYHIAQTALTLSLIT